MYTTITYNQRKVNQTNKTDMRTKFIKVAVSERLPKKDGRYFVWVNSPNAELRKTEEDKMDYNMHKSDFVIDDNIFLSFYEVTHWLEEVFDNEESLLKRNEELEACLGELRDLKYIKGMDCKTPYYLERQPKAWEKATELLNKVKTKQ